MQRIAPWFVSTFASLWSISRRRWAKLLGGLVCFGFGIALMKQANLGLGPWEVLSDGLSSLTGQKLGTASIVVGIIVLLLWIPMREKPGIGTVLNIFLIGIVTNLALNLIRSTHDMTLQGLWLVFGVGLIGLGSALYLGSQLGAGPRDGLMLGLHRKTGWSLRLTRTVIEIVVVLLGYFLGGAVGIGTLVFALSIGPVIQWLMWLLGQSALRSCAGPRRVVI